VYVITVVDNREKALQLGADGFHSKPVDRMWLLNHLEAIQGAPSKPRVLVIDDDPTARYLVRSLLANSDCELVEAVGGSDGLRMVKECKPALVVLDLAMEDIDGFHVLTSLREDAESRDLPVIVHTSMSLAPHDYERLSSAIDIIPKNIMSSRELAAARFAQAFQQAGLTYISRANDQPVVAE
jgi:CheY-like chemotaxis protein